MANRQVSDLLFSGANQLRDSRLQNPSEPLQSGGFGTDGYTNVAPNSDMTTFQLVQSVIQPSASSSMGPDASFRSVSLPSFT
jgi:hypothetical protein